MSTGPDTGEKAHGTVTQIVVLRIDVLGAHETDDLLILEYR
jgi:hypothetical protein